LPDWSSGKVYDNCLINKKEIWEVHGIQHYKHSFKKIGKRARTLKEEQVNDELKKKLAKENGYKYIEIDARKSELEWIKNSILDLPEIKRYDLSKINWLQCHEFALSSLVKIVCDYWKNGIKNTKDIAKIIKLHHTTIIRYLKKGVILGWCDYDPKEALKNSVANNGRKNNKHIVQLSKNGEFIRKWDSMISASKELNIRSTSISEVCRGKYKSASNYKWMYEEDYNKQYINNDELKE
jgi:hypothetical protein